MALYFAGEGGVRIWLGSGPGGLFVLPLWVVFASVDIVFVEACYCLCVLAKCVEILMVLFWRRKVGEKKEDGRALYLS